MRLGLLAYCLGVFATSFIVDIRAPLLWPLGTVIIASALLLRRIAVQACSIQCSQRKTLYRLSTALICFSLGVLWHSSWAASVLDKRLPLALEGKDMQVQGVVIDLPRRNDRAQQFLFQIENSDLGFNDRRVLLNYYGEETILGGRHYHFVLRLNRPHGFANPGSFDYELSLFQRGITAKGYVRDSVDNHSLAKTSWSLPYWRQQLKSVLLTQLKDLPNAAILLALTLGDSSLFAAEDWQLFSATGTNHLFVISGLHIGLVASVCYFLAQALMRLTPALFLRLPVQKAAAIPALMAAVVYSLLAGFGLASQRALVMLGLFLLMHLLNRPLPMSIRFLTALAVVLSIGPLAGLSPGFWFSFLAVVALCFCIRSRGGLQGDLQIHGLGLESKLRTGLGTLFSGFVQPQLLVFVVLAAPLIYWQQELSLLGPLVNIFAIPIIGFLVVPLALSGLIFIVWSPGISGFLLGLADVILSALIALMNWLTSVAGKMALLEFASLHVIAISGLALVSLLLLIPHWGGRRRSTLLFLLLVLLAMAVPRKRQMLDSGFDLHVLDVGQGLAVIVQTAKHSLVYDTGADLGSQFSLGSDLIYPILARLGIQQIDTIVISHADSDHAGGLAGLLEVITSKKLVSSAAELPVSMPVHACRAGDSWNWDGVIFEFLHPDQLQAQSNNDSCVLRISYAGHSVLLPGDIDASVERQLVIDYREKLQSTVLLAPHHGSGSSSSYAFIKAVNPQSVVFSAGYRNRFQHPLKAIESRYAEFGIGRLTTLQTGMLSFSFRQGGEFEAADLYRQRKPRYWY